MSTKFCPNCGAEVPAIANLCKHCFHDFNVKLPKKKSPWWSLLFLFFGCSIVLAMAFAYVNDAQRSYRVAVDEETASMVFTTTFGNGSTSAERVYFKDISKIEYVKNTRPRPFEIAVITVSGDRLVYQQGADDLDLAALALRDMTGRPLEERDEYARGTK